MNLGTINKTLEEYIAANWVVTPYSYEGIPHLNMAAIGQPLLEDGTDPYVIFDILHDDTQAVTVPAGCVRHSGYLSAAIYVPEDTGTRKLVELKDSLNQLFLYQTLTGNLRLKRLLNDGRFEAPGWTIAACQWPFETEETI